jgi:hypothetical protein
VLHRAYIIICINIHVAASPSFRATRTRHSLRSRFRGENAICMCNLRRRCARPKNYLTIITVACARGSARKQLGRRGRGHSPSQRTPGSQPFIHSQVSSKLSRSLKSPERLANVGKFRREEETVRRARSSAADKLVFSHIAAASERARSQRPRDGRTNGRAFLRAPENPFFRQITCRQSPNHLIAKTCAPLGILLRHNYVFFEFRIQLGKKLRKMPQP